MIAATSPIAATLIAQMAANHPSRTRVAFVGRSSSFVIIALVQPIFAAAPYSRAGGPTKANAKRPPSAGR